MFFRGINLVFCALLISALAFAESEQEELGRQQEVTSEEELQVRSFVPVTFREKTAFKIYYEGEAAQSKATEKAQLASNNLEKALTASAPLEAEAPNVEILTKERSKLEVRVRGYRVVELERADLPPAEAFGEESGYAAQLNSDLSSFVDGEMSRLRIQRMALQLFLSIFFAVIGFVVFRQIHQVFNNAESILEQKRESFQPVIVLSETLISGQALGGLLALTLAMGRMLAYVVVVLSTMAAIFGQFATSRVIMAEFFTQFLSQLVKGFQSLLESIPGFLLAALLVFLFQLALNILDLFLKGAKSGRISVAFLSPSRIPIVRFWGFAILAVVFFPLILASVFGRFNTPLELVILIAAGVLLLSSFPVLVNVAAGSFILWQGNIKPGQWIEVGGKSGEVSTMSIHKITIVPESGGRVYIPMILFLFQGCVEKKEAPQAEFRVSLKRKQSLQETIVVLESLFPAEYEIKVSCVSLSAKVYVFAFFAPQFQRDIRNEILMAVSSAHENGKIELTDELVKEVIH